MQMSWGHPTDAEYLIRQSMNTGYQVSSLLVPPAYVAYIVIRRGRGELSLNRVLRATWIGGLGGTAVFGCAAYMRYTFSNEQYLKARRVETAYDVGTIRRTDNSTIGGVLAAVLTPALLWNRASIANLVLGGAGLGCACGIVAHYCRTLTGDAPPKIRSEVSS